MTRDVLEYTGERMVPELTDLRVFWEHIARYHFAARFARGRRVLDIACGEGYGTKALMDSGALRVTGVDISPVSCEHARRKYGIDARVGDALAIPCDSSSIDLLVSFETIEHVRDPVQFLGECVRVLAPGGIVVMSSPERVQYGIGQGEAPNPFHCSELTAEEFERMIASRFAQSEWYGQGRQDRLTWKLASYALGSYPPPQVRGAVRLQGWLSKLASRASCYARQHPELAIRSGSWLLDVLPYQVLPVEKSGLAESLYMVVVASQPNPV
jgi:2-polyprenyl-3-methyl-5-hydroxy-6-metoxy-1,4-benzoquinol methylase